MRRPIRCDNGGKKRPNMKPSTSKKPFEKPSKKPFERKVTENHSETLLLIVFDLLELPPHLPPSNSASRLTKNFLQESFNEIDKVSNSFENEDNVIGASSLHASHWCPRGLHCHFLLQGSSLCCPGSVREALLSVSPPLMRPILRLTRSIHLVLI